MGKLIKNLVESHAKSITGIDVEYVLNNEIWVYSRATIARVWRCRLKPHAHNRLRR